MVKKTGNSKNNILKGTAAADQLYGLAGNDTLYGLAGKDLLTGGKGNDTYIVDNIGDKLVELASQGIDTVKASVSFTLGKNLENLTLTGTKAINAKGNVLNNVLIGNVGNNTLDGATGADRMLGGKGHDSYIVDHIGDRVVELAAQGSDLVKASISYALGAEVENLTLTGGAAINGTGNVLANTITGNTGANILDGGAGADILIGGAGDDIYVLVAEFDAVLDASGIDTITSTISRSLAGYSTIENLNLLSGNIDGTGNALANTIIGTSGNNVLEGGAGSDVLNGGYGDDIYVLNDEAEGVDTVIDAGGIDTITTNITRNLMSYASVENLTLLSGNINGTGNDLANVITGSSGDNILDGGVGADALVGGAGNDTYVLGSESDTITDVSGIDTIASSIARDLTNFQMIENLTLTGTASINATGNTLANIITGNSGFNIIYAGDGSDIVHGGGGNDILIGDNGDDQIFGGDSFDYIDGGQGLDVVYAGGSDDTVFVNQLGDIAHGGDGIDTIWISRDFSLATGDAQITGFENITLTGNLNINAFGNSGNNIIDGNIGNNFLSGGGGNDTLRGGAGNDIYDLGFLVAGVAIIELSGVDGILSSLSLSLSDYTGIENLTLNGGNIDGTGNDLANVINGSSGNNILSGGAGADTLIGGLGDDTLIGGDGADTLTGGDGADIHVVGHSGDQDVINGFGTGIDSLVVANKITKLGNSNSTIDSQLDLTASGIDTWDSTHEFVTFFADAADFTNDATALDDLVNRAVATSNSAPNTIHTGFSNLFAITDDLGNFKLYLFTAAADGNLGITSADFVAVTSLNAASGLVFSDISIII